MLYPLSEGVMPVSRSFFGPRGVVRVVPSAALVAIAVGLSCGGRVDTTGQGGGAGGAGAGGNSAGSGGFAGATAGRAGVGGTGGFAGTSLPGGSGGSGGFAGG